MTAGHPALPRAIPRIIPRRKPSNDRESRRSRYVAGCCPASLVLMVARLEFTAVTRVRGEETPRSSRNIPRRLSDRPARRRGGAGWARGMGASPPLPSCVRPAATAPPSSLADYPDALRAPVVARTAA